MNNKQISTRYFENGIEFQSQKYPEVSYGTTYEDDDKIWHSFSFCLPNAKRLRKMHINPIIIVIDVILIAFAIFMRNPTFITISCIFAIFLSWRLVELSRKKSSQASKFHAAKHKVFNAWKNLNYERIPTLDETKEASQFSEDCNDNRLLNDCVFYTLLLIVSACTIHLDFLFIILSMLVMVLCIIAYKFNLIQYLQIFCITKPSDRELKLVLEALNEYLKLEESVKVHFYEFVEPEETDSDIKIQTPPEESDQGE